VFMTLYNSKLKMKNFKIGADVVKADEVDLSTSVGQATNASFFVLNFKF